MGHSKEYLILLQRFWTEQLRRWESPKAINSLSGQLANVAAMIAQL
jgi:hypothetical protein